MSHASDHETLAKPESLLRLPLGLTSPLWGLFAGAAVTGATWWWMTRWVQPQNLEALFGATTKTVAVVDTEVDAISSPMAEGGEALAKAAPELMVGAAAEPAAERVSPATAEQVAETVVEAACEPFLEPVADAVVETTVASEPLASNATHDPLTAEAIVEPPLAPKLVAAEAELGETPLGIASRAVDVALEAVAARPSAAKTKKKAAAAKVD